MAERTSAFYAHAGTYRGFLGLAPYPVWLAWFGPLLRPLVENHPGVEFSSVGQGLLRQDSAHPDDSGPPPWPAEILMRLDQPDPRVSPDFVPAAVIATGL